MSARGGPGPGPERAEAAGLPGGAGRILARYPNGSDREHLAERVATVFSLAAYDHPAEAAVVYGFAQTCLAPDGNLLLGNRRRYGEDLIRRASEYGLAFQARLGATFGPITAHSEVLWFRRVGAPSWRDRSAEDTRAELEFRLLNVYRQRNWDPAEEIAIQLQELVNLFAPPVELVVDPSAGDGLALMAVCTTGRPGLGFVPDPDLAELTAQRLAGCWKRRQAQPLGDRIRPQGLGFEWITPGGSLDAGGGSDG